MSEYVCKRDFKINVYDAAGALTTQVTTVEAGTVFTMLQDQTRTICGKTVFVLDSAQCTIEVSFDTLKKNFGRIKKPRHQPEPGSLGERARGLRNSVGLTQKGLAQKLGVAHNVVTNIEQNRYDPSLTSLLSYADFFDVSIDWIVGRDEKYYGGNKR